MVLKFYKFFSAKMVARGQAQVDALFKYFAFMFPASEAVKSNTTQVLLTIMLKCLRWVNCENAITHGFKCNKFVLH